MNAGALTERAGDLLPGTGLSEPVEILGLLELASSWPRSGRLRTFAATSTAALAEDLRDVAVLRCGRSGVRC